jgi:hypothetical protein
MDGIVDTGCIATRASALALADKGGNLYASTDGALIWSCLAKGLPTVSSVLIV